MNADELVKLSKKMSYALRHDPASFGLVLARDGSVNLDDLVKGLGGRYTNEDVLSVLTMPGKRRFTVENGRIRAYYGHTVKTLVERQEIEPPAILYHATSRKALPTIMKEGLKPMNRQHVHLASTKETALVAGHRRDPMSPLLQVDAALAYSNGIRFYRGNEDIVMSDPIPPEYLKIIEK